MYNPPASLSLKYIPVCQWETMMQAGCTYPMSRYWMGWWVGDESWTQDFKYTGVQDSSPTDRPTHYMLIGYVQPTCIIVSQIQHYFDFYANCYWCETPTLLYLKSWVQDSSSTHQPAHYLLISYVQPACIMVSEAKLCNFLPRVFPPKGQRICPVFQIWTTIPKPTQTHSSVKLGDHCMFSLSTQITNL